MGGFKILAVEDTPIAQILVKTHLVKLGCLVDIVASGTEALNKAAIIKYDVILMDIGLGDGLDGFEVAVRIQQTCLINKKTPIFALTANNDDDYQKKAIAVGMVGFFNKPFSPENALQVIGVAQMKAKL